VMGSDEHHRLNKAKHQELLKERHELVKNILEKDPLSGKPWNICAKTSKKVAREFLQKWKPQMLHLEVSQGTKMGAVFDLVEVQRMAGRKFCSSWPAAVRFMVSTCGEEDLEDVPKQAGDCESGRWGAQDTCCY